MDKESDCSLIHSSWDGNFFFFVCCFVVLFVIGLLAPFVYYCMCQGCPLVSLLVLIVFIFLLPMKKNRIFLQVLWILLALM